MITYLAIVGTVAAVASVVRCGVAIAEYRRGLVLVDEGRYLRIIERVAKHG